MLSQILGDGSTPWEVKIIETVKIIPKAFQFPEKTCVQMIIGKRTFKTDNFRESQWFLTADIDIFDKKEGEIQIYSSENYLPLEISLISTIAYEISSLLEREKLSRDLSDCLNRS